MADMNENRRLRGDDTDRLDISFQVKWHMRCGKIAAEHEVDGSRLINVDMTIDALESSEEPLSETEQELLDLCKAAEAEGS